MHKTIGNILVFLGSAGIIAHAVQYLARTPLPITTFPIAIVFLVIGSGMIKHARKQEGAKEA